MTDVLKDASVKPREIKGYGWKPSLPDLRDHIADASELPVLDEVDPRKDLPPVFDQGQLGSCTANAVAAAVEYDAKLNDSDPGLLSRLWIYYYERKLEGSPADQDTGAYGRDGFKVCKTIGVPLEKDWPYDIAKFSQEPSAELADEAREHRISNYRRVPRNLDSIKAVLSNRQTMAFGFTDGHRPDAVAQRADPGRPRSPAGGLPQGPGQLRPGAQLLGGGLGAGRLLPHALDLHLGRQPRQRFSHHQAARGQLTGRKTP